MYNLIGGSPPPMRGKDSVKNHVLTPPGITPAYAGKSLPAISLDTYTSGSPPPMRGKVRQVFDTLDDSRITPAYAGKSGISDKLLSSWQDHPRLCGEKFDNLSRSNQPRGSPPPMRGKVPAQQAEVLFSGITPAYAGKSGTCCCLL